MSALDRYVEILAEHKLTPFYREPWINPRTWRVEPGVLGERPPFRWRVSSDEWDRLLVHVESITGDRADLKMRSTLMGWPIESDDALPPNSIIFEPLPSSQASP